MNPKLICIVRVCRGKAERVVLVPRNSYFFDIRLNIMHLLPVNIYKRIRYSYTMTQWSFTFLLFSIMWSLLDIWDSHIITKIKQVSWYSRNLLVWRAPRELAVYSLWICFLSDLLLICTSKGAITEQPSV